MYTADTPLHELLKDERARAILQRAAPELMSSRLLHTLHYYSVDLVLRTEPSLIERPEARAAVQSSLSALAPLPPPRPEHVLDLFRTDYEDPDGPRGTAPISMPTHSSVGRRVEIAISGPAHGNPFVDVNLDAIVSEGDRTLVVPGFYDGDGTYRVRLLPSTAGLIRFETRSNSRSLDGIRGEITVDADDGARGIVEVDGFHFRYRGGDRFFPMGTTAYAWTHQPDEMQERTLESLSRSRFNKLRMCVFPKSYLYNENEPERVPFERTPSGWSSEHFDTVYFRRLEQRISDLEERAIEADLILFHPYDRWGFSTMSRADDLRYTRYVVARLASFPNVWWSLANEWDLLHKAEDDWEAIASVVRANDPYEHLASIHNCKVPYDHARTWVTHVSMQRIDVYKTAEQIDEWRRHWGKPVVVDECGYEGDIDQGWGNISGEEMVRRCWEGAVRGGYVGHSETYFNAREELWWSKGGQLIGASPDRIGFLRSVLESGPTLEPATINWDVPRAGADDDYFLYYFGANRPTFRRFVLDPSTSYLIDVIDTWEMTIEAVPGTFRGRFTIDMPGKPYIALRFRAVTV